MIETKDKIDLTLRVGLLASVIMQAYNPSDVLIIKVAMRSAKNMMADIEARVDEIERGPKK
jgi:phosphopantetheine adenylyltransferase